MIVIKKKMIYLVFISSLVSAQSFLPSFQSLASKDNVSPTVVITAMDDAVSGNSVSDGSITNYSTIHVIFTFSESTSNFIVGDITVGNGSISSFSGSGNLYTATFTPSEDQATTLDVNADVFTDRSSNSNIASSQFNMTNDNQIPYINSILVNSNNDSVRVSFSEGVYNTVSDSGNLEISDFVLSISGGSATIPATPSGISKINSRTWNLAISLSGTVSGFETFKVNLAENSVFDIGRNIAIPNQSNNTITLSQDYNGPEFSNGLSSIASDNSTVSVTFNEVVYNTNSGSGDLEASDFSLSLDPGLAILSSATPSSISGSGRTYTLGIPLTGVASTMQGLAISVNNSSVYDLSGNESFDTLDEDSLNAVNKVLNLNGTDDYAYLDDESGLRPAKFTLQAFINPSSVPADDEIDWIIHKNECYRIGLQRVSVSGGYNTQVIGSIYYNGSYENVQSKNSDLYVTASGGWSHIALTFGSGNIRLYVDGSSADTKISDASSVNSTTSVFSIGRKHASGTNYYNGQVDEIVFWNEKLSSDAISDLRNSGTGLHALSNSSSGYYSQSNSVFLNLRMQSNLDDSSDNGADFTGPNISVSDYVNAEIFSSGS